MGVSIAANKFSGVYAARCLSVEDATRARQIINCNVLCLALRMVNFGHVGDGNLHDNVQAPAGIAPGAFLAAHESAINRLVFDAVHRFGGSISAEHGIGQLKRQTLPRYHSPVALGLMRQIKQALDPHNTMNPNRLL